MFGATWKISLQRLLVPEAAQHRQTNRVVVLRARRQRSVEDYLLASNTVDAQRIAQCQFVLCQGAGLAAPVPRGRERKPLDFGTLSSSNGRLDFAATPESGFIGVLS
jgi:hypothetical protein